MSRLFVIFFFFLACLDPVIAASKQDLFKSIFGTNPSQQVQEDRVVLILDGEEMGEVVIRTVLFSKDFTFSPQSLVSLKIDSERLALISNSIDPQSGFVTTKQLIQNGFLCDYQKGLGQILIETPATYKKKLVHRIGGGRLKKKRPSYLSPAKLSGALRLEGRHHSIDHLGYESPVQLTVASILNLDNTVLNASAKGLVNQTESGLYSRLSWQLNQFSIARVDREWGLEYSVGDIDPVATEFLMISNAWGVKVGSVRDVNRYQRTHFGSVDFFLDRLATVELSVNGVILETFTLRSGDHQFVDIPFSDGVSMVQIVAKDPKTKQTILEKKEEFVFNSSLLERGKSELFGLVGAPFEYLKGEGLVDKVWTGALLFGTAVDDRNMLGGYVVGRGENHLFGLGLTQLFRVGLLRSAVGVSNSLYGTGLAGRVEYSSIPNTLPLHTQVNFFSEVYNDKFWNGNSEPLQASLKNRHVGVLTMSPFGNDSLKWKVYGDIQNALNQESIGRYGTTLELPLSSTSRLAADTAFEKNDRLFLRVLYSAFQTNMWSLDLNFRARDRETYAGFSYRTNLTPELELNTKLDSENRALNLSYKEPENGAAIAGNYVENRVSRYDAVSRYVGINATSAQWGHVFAGSGGYQIDPFGISFSSLASYSGPRANIAYWYSDLVDIELGRNRASGISYGTSVLFADGVFAISAPIQGSFAIVRSAPVLGDTTIIANGKVRSDGVGYIVVPTLIDGGENNIFIDAPDASMGVDLGKQSYLLKPNYNNGYLINFGSSGTMGVRCVLIDKSGKPFGQRRLRVSAIRSDTDFSDKVLLTSSEGELVIVGLSIGDYELFSGGSKTPIIRLGLSKGYSETLDLGEIRLQDEIISIKK